MRVFNTLNLVNSGKQEGYYVPFVRDVTDISQIWLNNLGDGGIIFAATSLGVKMYRLDYLTSPNLPGPYHINAGANSNYYWYDMGTIAPNDYIESGIQDFMSLSPLELFPVASLTLPAGEYDIEGWMSFIPEAEEIVNVSVGYGLDEYTQIPPVAGATFSGGNLPHTVTFPRKRMVLTDSSTVYMNFYGNFSSPMSGTSSMSAKRVR